MEKSWNRHLPDTTETVSNRAADFVWKGFRAVVTYTDAVCGKGIGLVGVKNAELEKRFHRSEIFPFYDITVDPKTV